MPRPPERKIGEDDRLALAGQVAQAFEEDAVHAGRGVLFVLDEQLAVADEAVEGLEQLVPCGAGAVRIGLHGACVGETRRDPKEIARRLVESRRVAVFAGACPRQDGEESPGAILQRFRQRQKSLAKLVLPSRGWVSRGVHEFVSAETGANPLLAFNRDDVPKASAAPARCLPARIGLSNPHHRVEDFCRRCWHRME